MAKNQSNLMTKAEVADELKLHPSSVMRMIKRGQMVPGFRLGASLRWRREDIEAFVAKLAKKP